MKVVVSRNMFAAVYFPTEDQIPAKDGTAEVEMTPDELREWRKARDVVSRLDERCRVAWEAKYPVKIDLED